MDKKLNLKNKKAIALTTLASFCVTTSIVCLNNGEANASVLGRTGSVGARIMRSSSLPTNNGINRSGVRRASTSVLPKSTSSISGGSSNSTLSKISSSRLSNSQLESISQRLSNLETVRELDAQRGKHIFNRILLGSGLVSSAAIVAGTVAGIATQTKQIKFSTQQAETDFEVQKDIASKKNKLNDYELAAAEQYIIDYYKEHYGIDLEKK